MELRLAIRQVLYLSSAVKKFTQTEIDEILKKARRRNAETGVTGVLFYLDGNFLQLLEGEDPALTETYLRIKDDSRHRGLTKLIDEEIAARSFPDWSMGFRAITAAELRDNPEFFSLVNGKWTVSDGVGMDQRIKIMLQTFLQVNDGRSF